MNEGTNEPRSIEERQDDIVADFLSIDDPLSQYEYLLEFAAALPALDEAQKTLLPGSSHTTARDVF